MTSPVIPFEKLDGKLVFCSRMCSEGQFIGTAAMLVERHPQDVQKAAVRVASKGPSEPRWVMFFEQLDIDLLEFDETSITGGFTCRGIDSAP